MKVFCAEKKSITIGKAITSEPAIISGQSVLLAPEDILCNAIERVYILSSVRYMSGFMKSVHVHMKTKRTEVEIGAFANGRYIFVKIVHSFAPSIFAASEYSL